MAGLVCHLDRCCHHFYSPLEKIYSDDKELTCSSTKPHVGFCDSIVVHIPQKLNTIPQCRS